MPRIAYVNGRYVPHYDAKVHIEDRGYQFADGIYEVCLVIGGRFWDLDGHLARMDRSLDELQMRAPIAHGPLKIIMKELLRRNFLNDALIYLQISRGVYGRYHAFPPPTVPPALVLTAKHFDLSQSDAQAEKGIKVITQPDIRWGRVDIKTVGLLPNALAKQAAVEAGAGEAWLVRDGVVTEGSSTNAWIIDKDGALITHPKSNLILGGITRESVIECARNLQIPVRERPFGLEEAQGAAEAFVSSATSLVMPVIAIDRHSIGSGAPGPVTMRLRNAYKEIAHRA